MKKLTKYILATFIILFLNLNAIAQGQNFSNDEIREQSKILYMGNKSEEAQKHILTIPEEDRTAFDYYLIGLTSTTSQDAIKAYDKSIQIDNKFHQSYFNIANEYFNLKDFDRAIYFYKQATKYNKDLDYGYYNLGCAYLNIDEYNNARKSFESAIKINPEEPDYYFNLGYTYKRLNHPKRADKAIMLYNELMKKRTSN